jgi:prepilin-type N-terminal cleavage/methylation domain-containing protein
MKPAGIFKSQPGGFTLLEVIIALIVGSILGAILLEFLGQTVHKSFVPVYMAKESMGLTAIVECINANYKAQMLAMVQSSDSTTDYLNEFKNDIENNNLNCGNYTASASWIVFNNSGEPNQFTEEADSSGENRVLKVTVVHGQHEITALYTQ